MGQFVSDQGPTPGEGGNVVHQVGVAGDDRVFRGFSQGVVYRLVGRIIFEPDVFKSQNPQARAATSARMARILGQRLTLRAACSPRARMRQ